MADERLLDEHRYLETRAAQLQQRLAPGRSLQAIAAAAARLPALTSACTGAPLPPPPTARLGPTPIVKPLPPEWFTTLETNAEMRWDSVDHDRFETPNERFFVRNHTATPLIDVATWQLRVFGSALRGAPDAAHARAFSYRQLRRMPSREITTVIECAGNGRSFFASQQDSPAPGTQWRLGAIGAARWRGVPLAHVLWEAGLQPRRAVDVLPEGLDPVVVTSGVDKGHVRRPLPIEKALHDALLVYEMNGEPLPPDHGFPVRLLVPGWIGVASIKWLGSIEVADRPLFSPWNTTQYRLTGPTYPPDMPPITDQPVRSAFELPFPATFAAGTPQVLHGRSWSGRAPIAGVDVSTDGGATWQPAQLRRARRHRRAAWTRWSVRWTPSVAGSGTLLARATDAAGQRQPDAVPFNDQGYLFWAVVEHPVVVV